MWVDDVFGMCYNLQEPGTNAEIKTFAEGYGAKFDMFSKIDVNGPETHPLWVWMKSIHGGGPGLGDSIKWNFTSRWPL